jgi:hypothetical protein
MRLFVYADFQIGENSNFRTSAFSTGAESKSKAAAAERLGKAAVDCAQLRPGRTV